MITHGVGFYKIYLGLMLPGIFYFNRSLLLILKTNVKQILFHLKQIRGESPFNMFI